MKKISLKRKFQINGVKIKESLKRVLSGSKKYLVLDIGSTNIKLVEYVIENSKIHVLNGFIVATPANSFSNGKIHHISPIAELISQKLKDEKITTRSLVVSITSNEIITREMLVPKIKSEDLDNFVSVNSADIFPMNLSTYSLGYSVIEEYKEKTVEMNRIMIAAIPRDIIIQYISLAEILKLELKTINYAGYELYNYTSFEIDEKEEGYAVIDIGGEDTDLIINANGTLKFNRVINRGSKEATNIIMKELGCSEVKAEHLKKQYNSVIILGKLKEDAEVYKVAKINQDVIADIMYELLRVIEFYNANNPKNRVKKIYLTGLGSKISGIEEYVENIIGIPVIRIKEFSKVVFEGNAKKLRNRQLALINCLGANKLSKNGFNFIKGDLELSKILILFNPFFYKCVICLALIVLLVASAINFNIFLINQETNEFRGLINANVEIVRLQNEIELEKASLDDKHAILEEIGDGVETLTDELKIIEDTIEEMSSTVKITINRYKLSNDRIQIDCKATSLKSGDPIDDIDYINAPYDLKDKLIGIFRCEMGKAAKPEDFSLIITLNN